VPAAAADAAGGEADSAGLYVPPPAPEEGSLEVRLFRVLNSKAANPVLDFVMPIVTDFRRNRVVVLLVWSALVLFGGNRARWAALMLIPLVVVTDQLSASVIKPLVDRARPCEVLGGVHLWYGPEGWITTPSEIVRSYKSSCSFPSSHATNITGAMLFLGLVYRKALAPLLFVALLVSYSRIYIGVHWTGDALGGIAVGAALGWLAWIVFEKVYRDRNQPRSGSGDEDGADGFLDDPRGGAPE
jgi:undecaprenyl-diphosphatase